MFDSCKTLTISGRYSIGKYLLTTVRLVTQSMILPPLKDMI